MFAQMLHPQGGTNGSEAKAQGTRNNHRRHCSFQKHWYSRLCRHDYGLLILCSCHKKMVYPKGNDSSWWGLKVEVSDWGTWSLCSSDIFKKVRDQNRKSSYITPSPLPTTKWLELLEFIKLPVNATCTTFYPQPLLNTLHKHTKGDCTPRWTC